MKKSFKIVIGLLILIALIVIVCIVINNIISSRNIAFPKAITINSGDNEYYARKRYSLWQYPDENDEISGITSPPMITDNKAQTVKEFLSDDTFIETTSDSLIVKLDNLTNLVTEDILQIIVTVYTEEKIAFTKNLEILNNTSIISLDELDKNTNYYAEIRVVYPYNSIVEYAFKFVTK